MADSQPQDEQLSSPQTGQAHPARRSRVVLGIGLLLCVVVACVAAILTMLERLETRNAAFQPPMTALERQRLLPQDPVLDSVPRLEGIRYGDEVNLDASPSSPAPDADTADRGSLDRALILQPHNLSADTHPGPSPARQIQ